MLKLEHLTKRKTAGYMFRKFLLLILFVAFIALLLTVLSAESSGRDLLSWASSANPSQKPLPKAWANTGRAEVHLLAATSTPEEPALSTACPATVSVQRGDTLAEIAKRCAISLTDLLAANPAVTNPNRIYPGQSLFVHGARGGADPAAVTAQPPEGGYAPGTQVVLEAAGFGPDAQVRIGIGLPGSGFKALGVFPADSGGLLSVTLTIPPAARSGERAFFLLSSSGVPTVHIVSEAFVIE